MNEKPDSLSRRKLIAAGAALGGSMAASGWSQVPADSGTKRRVLHIIGHSHIDAAWMWPWRDAMNATLTTFRSALDRMKETPGFRYSHSSSAHYRWVERSDPRMFAEVLERIRQKRWEVVGGWPVEPDCNVPSTESFVRHALYGKRYCLQSLGVDVNVGFNPDSFGHAAGIPMLLRRAGYGYYVFSRPNPTHSHRTDLPLLFWWEGPDGSRLLTLRIAGGYSAPATAIVRAAKANFTPGFDHAPFFLGVGNHGGGVTREQIRGVLAMQSDGALPELRWSTLREYFAAVESSQAISTLPVIKGELQYVARGCYSAHGELKRWNRRAERSLVQAETIALAANLSAGTAYPREEFAAAWWKVLFTQFHDMLSGTAIHPVYDDVRDSLGSASEMATASKVEALATIARRIDTRSVAESAVFLFNPLPWKRKATLEITADREPAGEGGPITHLRAKDGGRVPVQWNKRPGFVELSAVVELPPCGYKLFELARGEAPTPLPFTDNCTVSSDSLGLSSLRAEDGTELLAGPIGLVVIDDPTDAWGHGPTEFYQSRWRDELGRPSFTSSKVVEDGPVKRAVRQVARWRGSEIVLDIVRYAGLDAVELRFAIDWRDRAQMLKLEIPTAFAVPTVTAKVPGAAIDRPPNGGEEPYQDWLSIQGKIGQGNYSLALINNSTYSYDCMGGLLRTVLIKSGPFLPARTGSLMPTPPDPNNAYMDQGRQERTFWLIARRGSWNEQAIDRRAEEWQTPAEYVLDSAHPGEESWEKSYFEVSPDTVSVLAIKSAEFEKGVIVQIQERSGVANRATISSPVLKLRHTAALAPFEIKTFLVRLAAGGAVVVREMSLLEKI